MEGTATSHLEPLMYELANDGKWRDEKKPKVFLDREEIDLANAPAVLSGQVASVIAANDKTFAPVIARLDVRKLGLFELRANDIGSLARLGGLTHLGIHWATRLSDISVLQQLPALRVLAIEDVPKITDLDPVSSLTELVALSFSGGIWNTNRARTLAPVGALEGLEELQLLNLRVQEDGLRPLARCAALKRLTLSNQFETADYAYLSVHLPRTDCEMFAADTPLASKVDGKDVMITGKRKPFLNAKADAARIEKYRAAFRRLQDEFRAALG